MKPPRARSRRCAAPCCRVVRRRRPAPRGSSARRAERSRGSCAHTCATRGRPIRSDSRPRSPTRAPSWVRGSSARRSAATACRRAPATTSRAA
ncbi:MAG: hypothetical protein FJ148_03145 [Deltaproteobacteria bacterium]|nr:hypothetical protein [Deltaproteobacteria bacterium]